MTRVILNSIADVRYVDIAYTNGCINALSVSRDWYSCKNSFPEAYYSHTNLTDNNWRFGSDNWNSIILLLDTRYEGIAFNYSKKGAELQRDEVLFLTSVSASDECQQNFLRIYTTVTALRWLFFNSMPIFLKNSFSHLFHYRINLLQKLFPTIF